MVSSKRIPPPRYRVTEEEIYSQSVIHAVISLLLIILLVAQSCVPTCSNNPHHPHQMIKGHEYTDDKQLA